MFDFHRLAVEIETTYFFKLENHSSLSFLWSILTNKVYGMVT